MSRKLKFEGYEVNDWIRAWDFEPCEGRRDRYVEGFILQVNRDGTPAAPFAHYLIEVSYDAAFADDFRARELVRVPMECLMLEWDTRVELIAKPKEPPKLHPEGWVEYEGKGWFFDWSGDLAYAPILEATGQPDWDNNGVVCKACDDMAPIHPYIADKIMEMIK